MLLVLGMHGVPLEPQLVELLDQASVKGEEWGLSWAVLLPCVLGKHVCRW